MIACGPLPFLDGTVGHICTFFQMVHPERHENFVSKIDKPKKVLGFDEDGDNLIERSKYDIRGVFCVTLCPPVATNCNHN
jgi:hypothetical protein